MRHTGEDQVGTKTPRQCHQAQGRISCTLCAEAVDVGCLREFRNCPGRLRKQYQVHLAFFEIKVACKSRNDMLGSASTEMRNEQKNTNARCGLGVHAIVDYPLVIPSMSDHTHKRIGIGVLELPVN